MSARDVSTLGPALPGEVLLDDREPAWPQYALYQVSYSATFPWDSNWVQERCKTRGRITTAETAGRWGGWTYTAQYSWRWLNGAHGAGHGVYDEVDRRVGDLKKLGSDVTYPSVEFLRWDTWAMTWFSHWTWDVGLSDEDVRRSFREYVERWEVLNERHGVMGPHCIRRGLVELMGAEDRWRWRSQDVDGNDADRIPCRCAHCKEAGIVRIDH